MDMESIYPYSNYDNLLEKLKELKMATKNTLVLNVGGKTRTVDVTSADLEAISDFVKEQIDDNGTCEVTEKITELFEITDFPITRQFTVTVEFTLSANDDMEAEDKVHDMISTDGDSDYSIESVDDLT